MSKKVNMFSVDKYKGTLSKLKEKGKLNEDLFWFNIVTPFFQGLKYDIHDLDVTDFDSDNKIFSFKIDNGREVAIVSAGFGEISASDISVKGTFSHIIASEKKSVHYLQFDLDSGDMELYTILNDTPYAIMAMQMESDNYDVKYDQISKRLSYVSLMRLFENSGFSYFTSIIVIGQLNSGTYKGNRFIEEAIQEVFSSPEDDIIEVITDRVYDKHFKSTAMTKDLLLTKMMPLKDVLMDVVSDALGANAYSFNMDDYGSYELGKDSTSKEKDDVKLNSKPKLSRTEESVDEDNEDFDEISVGFSEVKKEKEVSKKEEPKQNKLPNKSSYQETKLEEDKVDNDFGLVGLSDKDDYDNYEETTLPEDEDDDGDDYVHDFIQDGGSLDSLLGPDDEDELEQEVKKKKDLNSILGKDRD